MYMCVICTEITVTYVHHTATIPSLQLRILHGEN